MSGNQSPRFPKYSGTMSADWFAPLTGDIDGFAHVDGIYTGSAYTEAFNLVKASAYWHVNMRAGIQKGGLRAEVFVKNLLNDKNYTGAARFTDFTKGNFDLNDFTVNVSPAEPRQVGVRVSLKM